MLKSYFSTLDKYTKQYGKKTILLWQCGSFFEVYGYKEPKTQEISGSRIAEFSQICDMAIATKKKCVGNKNVVMAGFSPIHRLDKYLPRLNQKGYTVAVWIQDESDPKHRKEQGIYSPGTYFNVHENNTTNNIMCLWIEKHGKTLIHKRATISCGMAVINNFTGKSNIFEFSETYFHNPTTFNEIERFYSIYSPNELIVIHNNYNKIEEVLQFTSVNCCSIHMVNIQENDEATNCEKQIYQRKLLETFYTTHNYESFYESLQFREHPFATQAFCYLLNFIYTHNPALVQNIYEPVFDNINESLILANHSLKQLNILPTNNETSVVQFINKCKTPMGKREFQYILLNPTTNVDYLNNEYAITDYIKTNYNKFAFIRKEFKQMKDLEKFFRKIILNKVSPCELATFYNNVLSIKILFEKIKHDKTLCNYIKHFPLYDDILQYLSSNINLDKATTLNSPDTNFFLNNNSLDQAERTYNDYLDQMKCIQTYLSTIIKESIRIHETEKSGKCLIATKRRIQLLKKKLDYVELQHVTLSYTTSNIKKEMIFDTEGLIFSSSIGSNMRIGGEELNNIYRMIETSKRNLREKLREVYREFIHSLQKYHSNINSCVQFVIKMDILITKAHISKKYNYCKPTINTENENSFIQATGLRHVLVEQIQTDEIYVPNDVHLDSTGIVLYGTNAVGKSCFIRSIGISIILAQAGMFVPGDSFVYKPYTAIFTRILGNDNIFKGLSTFAVEMSELRTILRLADKNSLVLGDELCSGTDTNSAISIFVSGLIHLHEQKSSFIFATHFHEISNMISDLHRISIKHMAVQYNHEQDSLIYYRKLKEGPGNSMYGLEVCKSLDLPSDFLKKAYSIRNKNSIIQNKSSRYNAKKIKSYCEICGNKGEDVHHLQYQENADEDGFICYFNKNHVANLVNICKKCHKEVHRLQIQYVKRKTTKGIIMERKI